MERKQYLVTETVTYAVHAHDEDEALMEVRLAKRRDEVVLKGMPHDDDDVLYVDSSRTAKVKGTLDGRDVAAVARFVAGGCDRRRGLRFGA